MLEEMKSRPSIDKGVRKEEEERARMVLDSQRNSVRKEKKQMT